MLELGIAGGQIAKVAVSAANYAIDKPYDYLVPPELEGQVLPGMRVAVPFGSGNRGSDGIVLSLERQEENTPTLKPVLSCLDDAPVLDEKGIQLALWMRERYFCTVSDAVKAMLPAGMYFALRDSVTLVPGLASGQRASRVSPRLHLPRCWQEATPFSQPSTVPTNSHSRM